MIAADRYEPRLRLWKILSDYKMSSLQQVIQDCSPFLCNDVEGMKMEVELRCGISAKMFACGAWSTLV